MSTRRCADNQKFFPVSETLVQNLKSDWESLVKNFSNNNKSIGATFEILKSNYSENHRYYHNLSHVNALLFAAEDFREQFPDYDSMRLAVWFHDAIYQPRRKDNEIKSAGLAEAALGSLNAEKNKIQKVKKMILATEQHNASELDFDGKLFLDLDLSILAANEITYRKYSAAIRCEYAHVSEFLYSRGRRQVLENFLRREFIYFTSEMRRRFEARARFNIENEIKELS